MEALTQTNYAIDTFYFLVMGAMVMFMAPGFAMLEAGLVRAKNTSEILTKKILLDKGTFVVVHRQSIRTKRHGHTTDHQKRNAGDRHLRKKRLHKLLHRDKTLTSLLCLRKNILY